MPLSPSNRVAIKKKLAEFLAFEEWPLIDTTLREFGFPTRSEWRGDKSAYVLEMAIDARDENLIDVARHMDFSIPSETNAMAITPTFWTQDTLRIFVSHLATHRESAGILKIALARYGISCFVAHNDIEPTSEWQNEIETALASCESLVALLHPDFHKSNWTDQEIGFVMGRGCPTFAVRLGETPYGFIGRFQAFNGQGKTIEGIASDLFDSYCKHAKTRRRMADVLITLFEKSSSYATAKERTRFLEKLSTWDDTFTARIEKAAVDNTQIKHAIGVPKRVEALVKKWSTS